MRFALSALFALTLALSAGLGQDARFFPQVGDGVGAGLGLRTSFIFVNTGGDANFELEFFDGQGQPLVLTLGEETGASFEIDLPAGHSASLETTGAGGLSVGYARFSAPESVGATAIFSGRDAASGILLFEAGVPATDPLESFTIFLDSTGNLNTGLALVGAGEGDAGTVTVALFDSQFQQIASREIPLAAGEHLSQFVNELFPGVAEAEELLGSVTLTSNAGPVAAVTLRQLQGASFPQAVPTLTAFPVAPGAESPE